MNSEVAIAIPHPKYSAWIKEWIKCRDCFDGQYAIKAKGRTYLPRLSGQTDEDYAAYLQRASFFAITSKTITSLVGMVTMRTPELVYPEELSYIFKDNSGVQFYELLTKGLSENLLMSRYGMLVDRTANGKVNVYMYSAENILNWRTDDDGNLTTVVLREPCYIESGNGYELKQDYQYRVLNLKANAEGPVYTQTLYESNGQFVSEITITNTGKTMPFIPFVLVNAFGVDHEVVKPMMLDICDVNLSHYRTSADLENGRHYTGIPTPIVTGAETTGTLKVGGTEAWVIPSKDAKAFYLEFKGEGLKSLENALKEKEAQLANMSARMTSNNGSEAADTVRLRYMSETASLATVSRAVEAGLNVAFKYVAIMEGFDINSVSIKLDKEFLNTRMKPEEVLKLTQSYNDGGMSVETYVYNLRRGDVLSSDRSDKDEIESIEKLQAAKLQVTKPTNTPPSDVINPTTTTPVTN